MRTNMDPLTPTTSTLSPAMAHIAVTAELLATKTQQKSNSSKIGVPRIVREDGSDVEGGKSGNDTAGMGDRKRKQRERETVKWVLDAPRRLKKLVGDGEKEAAFKDWIEVKRLLDKWSETDGVEEVRRECAKVMELAEDDENGGDEDEESAGDS